MVITTQKKPHISTFVMAGLKLIRFPNLIILGLTVLMVYEYLVLQQPSLHALLSVKIWLVVFSIVLTAAAGYVINDYYDIKIDYVNKPRRVLVGRIIARRTAIIFHSVMNVVAVAFSAFVGWKFFISVLFSSFLLWYYANSLKRKPLAGNLVVSFLSGFSIYLVGLLRKGEGYDIVIFSCFAFLISLIRELVKDMEDIKGDAAFGCKTLPILLGERKTKVFVIFLAALFITMLAFYFYPRNESLAIYCGVILLPLIGMLIIGLIVADTTHRYRRISALCKWIMLAGILTIPFFR
ncbi:MAG TPA: geranylgeranylglycerol-phosphate geranylgeranyltransferase [Cytophagaceae bacterium]|jgi:4-hydroxybenzoate polyprenyltransferase|nr:geranylgeranylglycerol-phosphate geranylgeranyltransferase [Cytophagaceae bacterium]